MSKIFYNICYQINPSTSTPWFTAGESDHEPVSSKECMPKMVALQPCSRQIHVNIPNQVHAYLLTDNAGATQFALVVVWNHFWCVGMSARIVHLLARFMNKKLFFSLFDAVLWLWMHNSTKVQRIKNAFWWDTSVLVFRLMDVRLQNLHVSHVWHFVRRYLCAGQ